ncbi:MAG: GIY-YIG nuclease family protein [Candidatus Hadarchaeaceae archaeon]
MTTYYVYLLRSMKDGRFYTGHTANLRNRLAQHNGGRVRSTKARRPLELVYWESFKTRAEVMRREKKLKAFGLAEKEKLVKGFK